jgi:murein DD-endopeptidase MepM/ murein hydrolase activator NlpD
MTHRETSDRRMPEGILRSFLLFGLVIFCYGLYRDANISPAPVNRPPVFAGTPRGRVVSHVVRSGETFAAIFSSQGLPPACANEYSRCLKPLGFSLLFPGDSLVFRFNPDSCLNRFSLLSRLACWYTVAADRDSIVAQRKPVVCWSYECFARGILSASLAETMDSLDVDDAVVNGIADIFAWDVNFFMDPRAGDTVEAIFDENFADGRNAGCGPVRAAHYVNNGRSFWAVGLDGPDGRTAYYDLNGKSVQKEFLKAPLRYNRISSRFSFHRRHPILGIVRPHLGIDYAAPNGTPVYAAADGTVSFAGAESGFGHLVRVRHGGSYETSYGHLSSFARGISGGAHVRQGDLLGYVGSTGLSTGPHLDYRMKANGRFINPMTINLPSKSGVSDDERSRFDAVKNTYCAIMRHRFIGRTGCWVLDISNNADTLRTAEFKFPTLSRDGAHVVGPGS